MQQRAFDLREAATLFLGADLDGQVCNLPPVLREFRYFDTAEDAVRAAFSVPRERQEGSFLVQFGRKFDMGELRRLGAGLAGTALAPAATGHAWA